MAREPLPALLSPLYVAFTIECDNEFERRSPHRTSTFGGSGPWLSSMAMWWTCMRFVPDEGISVQDLVAAARTQTNLHGMARWGYITVDAGKIVRATAKGRLARAVWRGLTAEVEARWAERAGGGRVERLRAALIAILAQIPFDLPDCLPILGYGLACTGRAQVRRADPPDAASLGPLSLPILLARVLLALALDFERGAPLSLAIAADVLRVLRADGVPARDLPRLSGVSKEAIQMALGILEKRELAAVAPGRVRMVRLTPQGVEVQERCARLLGELEERWETHFGREAVAELREAAAAFDEDLLFAALVTYAGGWRARVPKPEVLPRFPMVLHRGGYPDGA